MVFLKKSQILLEKGKRRELIKRTYDNSETKKEKLKKLTFSFFYFVIHLSSWFVFGTIKKTSNM